MKIYIYIYSNIFAIFDEIHKEACLRQRCIVKKEVSRLYQQNDSPSYNTFIVLTGYKSIRALLIVFIDISQKCKRETFSVGVDLSFH